MAVERSSLHRLIDTLAEDDLKLVADVVGRLIAGPSRQTDDDLITALEAVPYDDEPTTQDDLDALNEAMSEPLMQRVPAHLIGFELTRP